MLYPSISSREYRQYVREVGGKLSSQLALRKEKRSNCIDMFKQHEIPLFIYYSTQKSDIGTVVGLENIF